MNEMERHFPRHAARPCSPSSRPFGALALCLRLHSRGGRARRRPPAANPEMKANIAICAVAMAKMDSDFLVSELRPALPARALPDRALRRSSPPLATAHAARLHHEPTPRTWHKRRFDRLQSPNYAAPAVNYRVPSPPQFEPLDVAYLGTVILNWELAGVRCRIPTGERKRLICCGKGRYYTRQADEILAFHRR